MQDTKNEIEALNKEAKLYMDNWSILDKAEKLVKECGIENIASIYLAKSRFSDMFVYTRKKIEKLQDLC